MHFEEWGICESSKICARYYTDNGFSNFKKHTMGSACWIDTAGGGGGGGVTTILSVYTNWQSYSV